MSRKPRADLWGASGSTPAASACGGGPVARNGGPLLGPVADLAGEPAPDDERAAALLERLQTESAGTVRTAAAVFALAGPGDVDLRRMLAGTAISPREAQAAVLALVKRLANERPAVVADALKRWKAGRAGRARPEGQPEGLEVLPEPGKATE